jgi:hypothetical protein
VRAARLDAVVRERAGEHPEVPVAQPEHAPHVVDEGLVGEAMVGGIVTQIEGAEARAEAPDTDVQLVGEAIVEMDHVGLEAVAPDADLHVDGGLLGDLRRELHGGLGGEAAERGTGPDRRAALRREMVVELERASDVAVDGPRRLCQQRHHQRDQRHDEKPA